jgi:hypothetical protein
MCSSATKMGIREILSVMDNFVAWNVFMK